MRRARTTTGTGVICARYMCPRAVEAPGACARGSGVEKLKNRAPCPGLTFQNVCLRAGIIMAMPRRSIRRQVVCVHKDCAILEMVRMSAPCARLFDVRVVVKPTRALGVGNLVFVNDD